MTCKPKKQTGNSLESSSIEPEGFSVLNSRGPGSQKASQTLTQTACKQLFSCSSSCQKDHGVLATGTDPGTAAAGREKHLPSITAISLTPCVNSGWARGPHTPEVMRERKKANSSPVHQGYCPPSLHLPLPAEEPFPTGWPPPRISAVAPTSL